MTDPAPNWQRVPVFGTYKNLDRTAKAGSLVFTVSERVVDNTDDLIFPGNGKITASLDNAGHVSVDFPAVDDPDVSPNGTWSVKVEERFSDGSGKVYYIQPTLAMIATGGLNLRTVVIPSDAPDAPPMSEIKGKRGGLAALDADGDVLDADGDKVLAASSQYAALARNPDLLVAGAVTRDGNGAATSAPVVWPDGKAGTYTALVLSSSFPGAVDSYKITYGSPVTKTYTRPTITRDSSGSPTNVPAIVVS